MKISFELKPHHYSALQNLCGIENGHWTIIEDFYQINLFNNGFQINIEGEDGMVLNHCKHQIQQLYIQAMTVAMTPKTIYFHCQSNQMIAPVDSESSHHSTTKFSGESLLETPSSGDVTPLSELSDTSRVADDASMMTPHQTEPPAVGEPTTRQSSDVESTANSKPSATLTHITTRKRQIQLRNVSQQHFVHAINQHDINFGIGPAGTGKTFLTVAMAVQAFEKDRVEKIVLTRPAVEAGEKLGFLPGDLSQKVDPYLRPLYDVLYYMLGNSTVEKLLAQNIIEVLPLAFMRGRTLYNSFIILDEAQNTTQEQMKMFLTRMGFGSKILVTGDVTQSDLPRNVESGLKQAMSVLNQVRGVSFTEFSARDVVRHQLVQRVVQAYERHQTASKSIDIHLHD